MRLRLLTMLTSLVILTLQVAPLLAQIATTSSQVTVQPYRATNVRSGPGVTFDVIAELQQGQVVEATGRSDVFSNWLQVNLGTRRGWVAFFTVAVSGEVNNLPIVEVSAPTSIPTATPQATVTSATTDIYATAYRRVNIRSGPGTDFEVVGVLLPGQTADIIGTSGDSDEWIEIAFEGRSGWVAYFVVSISGNLEDLADMRLLVPRDNTAPAIEMTNRVLNQVIVITRFNTNLREEPILGSTVIDIVPYETTVQAIARTEDNRWLRVRHNDIAGWLISSLVNVGVSDIDSLPIMGLEDATAPGTIDE
jgi:N-acetylmuramoyl-L-alanine amidase